MVAWSGYSVSGEGVFAQRFDAAGAKVGGEIQISDDRITIAITGPANVYDYMAGGGQ